MKTLIRTMTKEIGPIKIIQFYHILYGISRCLSVLYRWKSVKIFITFEKIHRRYRLFF